MDDDIDLIGLLLYFRHLPPSQGGKYAGFGNTREPPPKSQSQEFFDTTLSSLASVRLLFLIRDTRSLISLIPSIQGWSLFSSTATKVAETAKEKAVEIGSIASQKVRTSCTVPFI